MKSDDLRDEYDLAQLKDGVRRKYHQRAVSDTNLVLIEPDLVNRTAATGRYNSGRYRIHTQRKALARRDLRLDTIRVEPYAA